VFWFSINLNQAPKDTPKGGILARSSIFLAKTFHEPPYGRPRRFSKERDVAYALFRSRFARPERKRLSFELSNFEL